MVTHATVKLWGKSVGLVVWNDKEHRAEFQYDRTFSRGRLNVAPLMMPLREANGGEHVFAFGNLRDETFRGLPGLLADSLPDRFGDQLMNAWLLSQGRQPGSSNPVERLCYTGVRGMGALEFEPAHNQLEAPGESLEVEDLVKMAGQVLDTRKQFATRKSKGKEEALLDIIRVGTSAGGARAKAIVAYNAKTGEVRSGQVEGLEGFTYCLIKFDGVTSDELRDPKGFGRIEYAYYLMAVDCGVEMMPCRLLEEHGRAHFLTQRFDRVLNTNGTVRKLHMATLCGIAHMDYNDPVAYSYEEAFGVMRQLGLPYPHAVQLFRRMCFNAIARNHNDHTKNISFLMDPQGEWHLSPAYDVTFAFNPGNMWLKQHQMSINGKRLNIDHADLLAVAKEMNIKKADTVINEVKAGVKRWKTFAKKADVNAKQAEVISRLHSHRI